VGHHSGLNYPMVEGSRVILRVDEAGTSLKRNYKNQGE